MQEKLLQFIWQYGYFSPQQLRTTTGQSIHLYNRGEINHNQGPDFSTARVRIGDTVWAGNIEIHILSSEWLQHGHEEDPFYQSVILHVVWQEDRKVNDIPVLELKDRVSSVLLSRYEQLMNNPGFIPCEHRLPEVDTITKSGWLERMLSERISRKAKLILDNLNRTQFNWEEVCWWQIASCFGNRQNAEAFAGMARSLSIRLLARHRGQIHQTEALIFGQLNLLNIRFREAYPKMLQKEYRYLQKKYGIKPVDRPLHFLRMRPVNFPTIRLAQLAVLLQSPILPFAIIKETETLEALRKWLDVSANDYWHYHYRFDEESIFREKHLGTTMQDHIILNAVVPLLAAYGIYHNQYQYTERALIFCNQMSVEKNQVSNGFRDRGWKALDAGESQAMLELKKYYCDERRCLECAIGYQLMKEPGIESNQLPNSAVICQLQPPQLNPTSISG